MSSWIDFVRKYAQKNNITYSCALSDKNCSKEYQAMKRGVVNNPEKNMKKAILKKKKALLIEE